MLRFLLACLVFLIPFQASAQLGGGGRGGKGSFQCLVPAGAPGLLEVHPSNGLYFMVKGDPSEKAVVLSGSHVWGNIQNWVGGGSGNLDVTWSSYLNTVLQNGHNFVRGWTWEDGDYSHLPFVKNAGGQYDLSQFDDAHFNEVCTALTGAAQNDLYISIMLFQGWSIEDKPSSQGPLRNPNPWLKHPFRGGNNVNGVNGDLNSDGRGLEVHTLGAGSGILGYQEAYVRLMVQRFNGFPNLIWEISNESRSGSVAWQNHMAGVIQSEEANLPNQHLISMNAAGDWNNNSDLAATSADIVSPNRTDGFGNFNSPPEADSSAATSGTGGRPVLLDTDHLLGVSGNYLWVWKAFTRGHHPIYMDPLHDLLWTSGGDWDQSSSQYSLARAAMGDVLEVAEMADLKNMVPEGLGVCGTAYCLVDPGQEYIIFQEDFDMDFTLNLPAGTYAYTWFDVFPTSTKSGGGVIQGHPGGNWTFSVDDELPGMQTVGRPLVRIVRTGSAPDVRLIASYLPSSSSARTTFTSELPDPPSFSFYYDESQGNFEERPVDGPCNTGQNNPTYLTMSYAGDTIDSCKFQASWDLMEHDCPAWLLNALNAGDEVVLNTDTYGTNPATCSLTVPQQIHLMSSGWMRATFRIGGVDYVRKLNFIKQ